MRLLDGHMNQIINKLEGRGGGSPPGQQVVAPPLAAYCDAYARQDGRTPSYPDRTCPAHGLLAAVRVEDTSWQGKPFHRDTM